MTVRQHRTPPQTLTTALTRWRGPLVCLVAVAVVVIAGVFGPDPWVPPARDRLGPAGGERVSDYLARARATMEGSGPEPRWALVSLGVRLAPGELPALARGVRVAQVLYNPRADRVQTPVRAQPVPAGDAALTTSASYAARGLWRELERQDPAGRGAAVTRLSASWLSHDCACALALVVRADLASLRALAGRPGVRAVQALPLGLSPLALSPLLPEHTDAVTPLPDDGPVPQ